MRYAVVPLLLTATGPIKIDSDYTSLLKLSGLYIYTARAPSFWLYRINSRKPTVKVASLRFHSVVLRHDADRALHPFHCRKFTRRYAYDVKSQASCTDLVHQEFKRKYTEQVFQGDTRGALTSSCQVSFSPSWSRSPCSYCSSSRSWPHSRQLRRVDLMFGPRYGSSQYPGSRRCLGCVHVASRNVAP